MGETDESVKKDRPTGSEAEGPQASPTLAADLKVQAQVAREIRSDDSRVESARAPLLVRSFYILLTFAVLLSAIVLLSFSAFRERAIEDVHAQWAEWSASASGSEIFRLPPPPPRVVEREVSVKTPPVIVPLERQAQVLYADQLEGGPPTNEGRNPPVVLEKTKDSVTAYNLLFEKSRVVRELKEGGNPRYKFLDWSTVKNSPPVFWIDLLVSDFSGGKEVHLVWSVNIETKAQSPLSQAARDLEAESAN